MCGFDKFFLPILVSAAEYSTYLRKGDFNFQQFLKDNDSQLWPVFEESLKNSTALVMIDGLDEEVDAEKRATVVKELEKFVSLYPEGNHFLVTSRIAGYSVNPLSSNFELFIIEPFS